MQPLVNNTPVQYPCQHFFVQFATAVTLAAAVARVAVTQRFDYVPSVMLRKSLKTLHELGAIGVMGSLAACLVLAATAPVASPVGLAAVRHGIAQVTQWLLVPALALMLVSGLLAIAATDAYKYAAWAWIKALLGISMFEGTLLTVGASARQAADFSALAASGHPDPAQLAAAVRTEWGGLWLLLGLSFVNLLLAVWRPTFRRRAAAS